MKTLLNVGPIAIFAIVLMVANYRVAGSGEVIKGLRFGGKSFVSMGLTLALVFIIMGQAQMLCVRYAQNLKELMRGEKGVMGGYVAGIFSPGIISALPVVKDMWEQGYPRAPLLMFLIASRLINLQLVLLMVPMIGWRVSSIQLAVGAVLAATLFPVLWFWR